MVSFAHLHTHSTYSDGLASPMQLARQAALLGYTALALTDHNTLAGHSAFINACVFYEIHPILGVELRVHTPWGHGHNVVLTRTTGEYQKLQWVMRRHRKVQLGDLVGMGYVTSACLGGLVAQAVRHGDTWKAIDIIHGYQDILGTDFLLEIQPTFGNVLPWICAFARNLHSPLITTNDVHYLHPEDQYHHVNSGLDLASEHEMRVRCVFDEYQRGMDYAAVIATCASELHEPSGLPTSDGCRHSVEGVA